MFIISNVEDNEIPYYELELGPKAIFMPTKIILKCFDKNMVLNKIAKFYSLSEKDIDERDISSLCPIPNTIKIDISLFDDKYETIYEDKYKEVIEISENIKLNKIKFSMINKNIVDVNVFRIFEVSLYGEFLNK